MKDGCIPKMTITETGHRATQYKKIIDTLLVLCADKNYRYIDDALCTWINLDKADFAPSYPNPAQCSNTHDVEIKTVHQLAAPIIGTDERPVIIVVEQRTHVLTQSFRNSYYPISHRNPKSSHKNILNLLPTRRL